MEDYRSNYFDPAHEGLPFNQTTDSDQYNSDEDRITEQEMVPDIVERLSTRYDINLNEVSNLKSTNNTHLRRKFKIPGLSKVRLIRLVKQLFALIPRVADGEVNTIDSVVIPIQAGDEQISFDLSNGKNTYPVIVRAYLSSGMIDMTPNENNNGGGGLKRNDLSENHVTRFWYQPTIPFKQNDELVVYYK